MIWHIQSLRLHWLDSAYLKFLYTALQFTGGHHCCGKDRKILDVMAAGFMYLFHIQPAVFMDDQVSQVCQP